MRSEGGPKFNVTGVLIKRGNLDTMTYMKGRQGKETQREEDHL